MCAEEQGRRLRVADDAPRSHRHNTCMICLEHLSASEGREVSQRKSIMYVQETRRERQNY